MTQNYSPNNKTVIKIRMKKWILGRNSFAVIFKRIQTDHLRDATQHIFMYNVKYGIVFFKKNQFLKNNEYVSVIIETTFNVINTFLIIHYIKLQFLY